MARFSDEVEEKIGKLDVPEDALVSVPEGGIEGMKECRWSSRWPSLLSHAPQPLS